MQSASNPASCQHEAELDIYPEYYKKKAGIEPDSLLDRQTDRQEDRWAGGRNGNAIFIRRYLQ